MCALSQKRFWVNACARVVRPLVANLLLVTLIIGAMTTEAWAQQCRQWQQVAINGRYGNRMAFDSNRNVTVMFGGIAPISYGASFDDTWEYDGTTWALRATGAPPPRMSHGMTFDSKRNVVVMFGGRCFSYGPGCGQLHMNDTWEWDGETWTLRATEGPTPRASVGLTYDSSRGVTVLFGGVKQEFGELTLFNDTWEWDGLKWTQLATTGPSPRTARAMAFDARRSVTVQCSRNSELQTMETWEWEGTMWSRREISNPPARMWHEMAFDSQRGVMVLHGGFGTQDFLTDTWEYDGVSWKLRDPLGPRRADYGLAFDSARNVCVAFGHYFPDQSSAETWEWDGATWKRVNEAPFQGSPHLSYYEPALTTVLLAQAYNPTVIHWTWDGTSYKSTGTQLNAKGPMAYDAIRKMLVMVSVTSQGKRTWEFDGTTWHLRAENQPPIAGSLSFDIKRGVTVLFGKTASGEAQTWEWNGSEWVQRVARHLPPPRVNQSMAYDVPRGVTVMHGGYANEPLLDTWEWDGVEWIYRGETHTAGGDLLFNPLRNRVVRMPPYESHYSGLFEWTGEIWVESPDAIQQLPEFDYYVLHHDPNRNVYVAYGQIFGKTWEFLPVSASPGDITCDGVVTVADLLAVSNAWGPCPSPPQLGGCPADIAPAGPPMGDGVVDVLDLLMVIDNWGS